MSQYPQNSQTPQPPPHQQQYQQPFSPYSPPNPAGYWPALQNPYSSLLAPARRAFALMLIMGILMTGLGACFAWTGSIPPGELPPRNQAQMQVLEQFPNLTLSNIMYGFAGCISIPGIIGIIIAIFVRRGSAGASVLGLLFAGGGILVMGLMLLGCFLSIAQQSMPLPQVAISFLMVGAGLLLFILLCVWLVQAIRASGQIKTGHAQTQAQYYYYQQMQQLYGQPAQPGQYPAQQPGQYPPHPQQFPQSYQPYSQPPAQPMAYGQYPPPTPQAAQTSSPILPAIQPPSQPPQFPGSGDSTPPRPPDDK